MKYPYSHWVKMGLNAERYSVWNTTDVTYPPHINDTEARDEYNKAIIVQRLKELGFQGYMKHLNEKIIRLWVSSQFSSYRLGEWFEEKNDIIANIVSDFDSMQYKMFNLYSFIIKLFILLGSFAAILFCGTKDNLEGEVTRICIISTLIVFAFLLLWETAPHHTYEAFALLNITASLGIYKLFTKLIKKRNYID